MAPNNITNSVIEVLQEYQKMSGRICGPIDESTFPITGLLGFDSLNGIEVTMEISHRLGIEIPDQNICVDKSGKRPLRVREIVSRICELKVQRTT